MNKENKIIGDLHLHSKASDGIWTPREVVLNAKARDLETIAITDHDTTYGVPEALDEAKKQGINVIPGIEIDAKYTSSDVEVRNLELLGLDINIDLMQPLVDKRNKDRTRLLEDYIQNFNNYLSSKDFIKENEYKNFNLVAPEKIKLSDVINWYNSRNLDQTEKPYENPFPFLSKMTLVQYVADNFLEEENKNLIMSGDRPAGDEFKKEYKEILKTDIESKPSFYEAIKAVKNAGGLAVLAHPGLSKGYEGGMLKEWELPREEWFKEREELTPFSFVNELKQQGLDGLEIYNYKTNDKSHYENHDLINQYFTELATKLDLITTAGSDCHGPKSNGPQMGDYGLTNLNWR
ncbi:MAG: PHP domain-containing protein [Nanobdellota archaeon]